MVTIIAAVGKNYEIGKGNKLPWKLPEDLKYFSQTTLNHKVVMGRRTFESLPEGPFKNRENIVVTRNKEFFHEGVTVIDNLDQFLKANVNTDEEIFIIGGASIYEVALKYAKKIILTEIEREFKDSDTFFPFFNSYLYTKRLIGTHMQNGLFYKRYVYEVN